MEYALTTENLGAKYGENVLFENVSVHIPMSQITSIIGPNGAGKTSFILAVMHLLAYSGKVNYFKPYEDISLGYVAQKVELRNDNPITIADFFSLNTKKPVFLGYSKKIKNVMEESLSRVALSGYEDKKLSNLSGGELQRTFLAFALSKKPEILILDEPSQGLDNKSEEALDRILLEEVKKNKTTVILVSHDIVAVHKMSNHVICLDKKLVCEGTVRQTLTSDVLNLLFHNPSIYMHEHIS